MATNVNVILLDISDKMSTEDLERMVALCVDLEDGRNPVGLPRAKLLFVRNAFDLFVLQHDYHKEAFLDNVIWLIKNTGFQDQFPNLVRKIELWHQNTTSEGKCLPL